MSVPVRTKKVFSLAHKIQRDQYTHPEVALRAATRLSKILNGHSPFAKVPCPLDPTGTTFTAFETSTGKIRAL